MRRCRRLGARAPAPTWLRAVRVAVPPGSGRPGWDSAGAFLQFSILISHNAESQGSVTLLHHFFTIQTTEVFLASN